MRMRRDFAFELRRLVDHGLELLVRVLRHAHRVAFGEYATRRARLDDVRAVFRLIPHRRAYLIRTVGDTGLVVAVLEAGLVPVLIAVTTRDADRVCGSLHARADDPAFVDRLTHRDVVEVRRADVTDGCKAGHQRVPHIHCAED